MKQRGDGQAAFWLLRAPVPRARPRHASRVQPRPVCVLDSSMVLVEHVAQRGVLVETWKRVRTLPKREKQRKQGSVQKGWC
jgi:hypothetical protein